MAPPARRSLAPSRTQGGTLEEARFIIKDAIRELGAARREKTVREIESDGRDVIREPLAL